MGLKSETNQYDYRGTKSSWRKWKKRLKKFTRRKARLEGKRLLEDAPKRVIGGWVS